MPQPVGQGGGVIVLASGLGFCGFGLRVLRLELRSSSLGFRILGARVEEFEFRVAKLC